MQNLNHFEKYFFSMGIIRQRNCIQDLKVALKATLVKPLHTNWLIMTSIILKTKREAVIQGFEKNEILEYLSILGDN